MLFGILLGLYVIIVILMTLVILVQEPREGGLSAGIGGGGVQMVLGVREAPTLFTRLTVGLGVVYAVLSLLLSTMHPSSAVQSVVLQELQRQQVQKVEAPPEEVPVVPVVPEEGTSGSGAGETSRTGEETPTPIPLGE